MGQGRGWCSFEAAQVLLRQEGAEGTDSRLSISIRVTEVVGSEDQNW